MIRVADGRRTELTSRLDLSEDQLDDLTDVIGTACTIRRSSTTILSRRRGCSNSACPISSIRSTVLILWQRVPRTAACG